MEHLKKNGENTQKSRLASKVFNKKEREQKIQANKEWQWVIQKRNLH